MKPSLYIEAFAHATEDPDKVIRAIFNTLPEEIREKATLSTEKLQGHYSNVITVIRLTVGGEEEVKAYLKGLAEKLTPRDKAYLRSSLTARVEEGNFYLRLDKDEAYRGVVKIKENGDSIKIRVTFKAKAKKVAKILEELKVL